ncbi:MULTISPECIES: nuclear transport factor 2 family protein [Roseobacteraceae]|uniref:nuclear transport factor 2 family protein n=1 Tax=Roseobacteraceae TaxID=2854170 RepID=UPI000DE999C1|nr:MULTISPECIES: nuclear transport factor 2 family protein [Roseobacteraceae]MBT8167489.1 nuclear transport factor 2 family protein [Falsiruegeria litorea]RBW57457.1 nuclear transport factor 2 family protein [Ruegeria sp. A3M17]
MNELTAIAQHHDAIGKVLDQYIKGAMSGKGDDMKPAFHADATVFGYVGDNLLAGPIQELFSWNDENGPATMLEVKQTSIDLADSVATARLELINWTGLRFTDLFTLLNVDGQWKIMNKVFHLHV